MSFLNDADSNSETITLITGNFNKLIELVKLISWFNKIFQLANSNKLIDLASTSGNIGGAGSDSGSSNNQLSSISSSSSMSSSSIYNSKKNLLVSNIYFFKF